MQYAERAPLAARKQEEQERSGVGVRPIHVALALLAVMVPVAVFVAVVLAGSASDSASKAEAAAASARKAAAAAPMAGMAGMDMSSSSSAATDTQSYAGAAPANADQLAMAHKPYPAAPPPLVDSKVVNVNLVLKDRVIEIAPGVKFSAWGWAGGVPGPVIHVQQGQVVHVTMRNDGAIPHSVDFHAARVAPNLDFSDIMPGKSKSFSFVASDPGVFMYHCGTKPVLMHIAMGMYGAIVVEPKHPLPHADRQYVLVGSEWYLTGDGLQTPASFSMDKARAVKPDWVTWNGYAGQYVTHPLTAKPGETVRFWIVDAGPSMTTAFHVVGTLLNRAWVDGDMTRFERNVQTADVPAGGGGVFDVKITKPGLYPFVSHSFASVDLGQVGVLDVGGVAGTMSH
jgi:nitrite reductase (NO-forming)